MTVVVTISSHDDRAYVFQSLKDLLRCGLNLCSFSCAPAAVWRVKYGSSVNGRRKPFNHRSHGAVPPKACSVWISARLRLRAWALCYA